MEFQCLVLNYRRQTCTTCDIHPCDSIPLLVINLCFQRRKLWEFVIHVVPETIIPITMTEMIIVLIMTTISLISQNLNLSAEGRVRYTPWEEIADDCYAILENTIISSDFFSVPFFFVFFMSFPSLHSASWSSPGMIVCTTRPYSHWRLTEGLVGIAQACLQHCQEAVPPRLDLSNSMSFPLSLFLALCPSLPELTPHLFLAWIRESQIPPPPFHPHVVEILMIVT